MDDRIRPHFAINYTDGFDYGSQSFECQSNGLSVWCLNTLFFNKIMFFEWFF